MSVSCLLFSFPLISSSPHPLIMSLCTPVRLVGWREPLKYGISLVEDDTRSQYLLRLNSQMFFFFLIMGLKTARKAVRDGFRIRKVCERCHLLSDLVEHRIRQYFTLFFLPIFPVSRGERTLVCTRCGASFPLQSQVYGAASADGVDIGNDEGPGGKT